MLPRGAGACGPARDEARCTTLGSHSTLHHPTSASPHQQQGTSSSQSCPHLCIKSVNNMALALEAQQGARSPCQPPAWGQGTELAPGIVASGNGIRQPALHHGRANSPCLLHQAASANLAPCSCHAHSSTGPGPNASPLPHLPSATGLLGAFLGFLGVLDFLGGAAPSTA